MSDNHCSKTGVKFQLSEEEIAAYSRFELAVPTRAPHERLRSGLMYRNVRNYFWRVCPETNQRIWSHYAPLSAIRVVANEWWLSGEVDWATLGRKYSFENPFFVELLALWREVPRPATSLGELLLKDRPRLGNRDNYLVHNSFASESCMYSANSFYSTYCVDCYSIDHCRNCYEAIDCRDCESVSWCYHSTHCRDSMFLFNCSDCQYCLFCTNLHGRKYCIRNQQVSKEEFEQAVRELRLDVRPALELAKEQFHGQISASAIPHQYRSHRKAGSGNYLWNTKNAVGSFECYDSRKLYHCTELYNAKDCIEGIGLGVDVRSSAAFILCGFGAKHLFHCLECWDDVEQLEYSAFCQRSRYLFGCVGLRDKEYCILNQQYSRDEYFSLRKKIIQQLKDRGEWGEGLPRSFIPFPYNHSSAHDYMPLSQVQAEMLGFIWDEQSTRILPSRLIKIENESPEGAFAAVPDTLLELQSMDASQQVFLCELTGRPYRMLPEEVEFYSQRKIAPPARSFEQRYNDRLRFLGGRQLRQAIVDDQSVFISYPESWRNPILHATRWQRLRRRGALNG